MKPIVYYSYNGYGYEIEVANDEKVFETYSAGNNPIESDASASILNGLPLSKIKEYCLMTAREMAKEYDAFGIEEMERNED